MAGQGCLGLMQLIVEYPDGGGQQIARKMGDILSRTAWTLTCSSSALALAGSPVPSVQRVMAPGRDHRR